VSRNKKLGDLKCEPHDLTKNYVGIYKPILTLISFSTDGQKCVVISVFLMFSDILQKKFGQSEQVKPGAIQGGSLSKSDRLFHLARHGITTPLAPVGRVALGPDVKDLEDTRHDLYLHYSCFTMLFSVLV